MLVKSETVTHFTLTLTEEEAQWLKAVVQNPLHGQSPESEASWDREMRLKFWQAMHPAVKSL